MVVVTSSNDCGSGNRDGGYGGIDGCCGGGGSGIQAAAAISGEGSVVVAAVVASGGTIGVKVAASGAVWPLSGGRAQTPPLLSVYI